MMTGRDLWTEWATALVDTPWRALAPLLHAGVAPETLLLTLPAATRATVRSGGLFEPDDREGGACFILPVRVDDPNSPETSDPAGVLHDGEIIDLLIFHPRRPQRWALRVGAASWLGAVEPQYCDPAPVRIRQTPLDWLQAGGDGLVLLGNRLDRHRILAGLRSIVADDGHHANELRGILQQPWRAPPVVIAREGRRHAA